MWWPVSITPVRDGYELRGYEASSTGLIPNTAGSTHRPRRFRAVEIIRKCSGEIVPLDFHMLTAGAFMSSIDATAPVPPRASTMASADLSMPPYSSPRVNVSSLHGAAIHTSRNVMSSIGMYDAQKVADRLNAVLELWQRERGISAQSIASRIKCQPNELSMWRKGWQFESGEIKLRNIDIARIVNLNAALPEIPFKWLLIGDNDGIDFHLAERLEQIIVDRADERALEFAETQQRIAVNKKIHGG